MFHDSQIEWGHVITDRWIKGTWITQWRQGCLIAK
jgi:hypothetical protein